MGAGINLFRQLFPEDYYAYQAATLISSKPVAKKVVGINQWDEEWQNAYINTNGEIVPYPNNIASKNYIAVKPNSIIHVHSNSQSFGRFVFYDINKNILRTNNISGNTDYDLNIQGNEYYIMFDMVGAYGSIYKHDISINLPSTDHNYHAYEEHTYPLGSDEIRGLLKVENGQLVAYGDIHPSDGNGTEVFGIVDLGELTYTYDTYFYANMPDNSATPINGGIQALSGAGYTLYSGGATQQPDMSMAVNNSAYTSAKRIFIKDSRFNDANAFQTAMSGVYLIYEKATPTAKSYTPFTNPMLCGSTEEFTDSRSLKMFCGHDSIYADNISFAHIDFGQTVTDGTLDVVHGILTPTGGSPVSVTPASIQTFSGVNNVFSNGGGDITAIYLDVL